MAEFLIYNKDHWMDMLNQEEYDEQMKNPQFARKYLARNQRGDVIEVRPDGYWTGAKAKKFRADTFSVVAAPGVPIEDTKQYGKSLNEVVGTDANGVSIYRTVKKCRFNIKNTVTQGEILKLSNVSNLNVEDKETLIG